MKIIICGKSGSGKDFLRRRMSILGFKYAKPYSTRPKRGGEKEEDYHYIDRESFLKLIEQNFFFDFNVYNDWFYGLSHDDWQNCNLFIMTPKSINGLAEQEINKTFIIYLDIEESKRIERIKNRADSSDSIERRIDADNLDFLNFSSYNLHIKNSDF